MPGSVPRESAGMTFAVAKTMEAAISAARLSEHEQDQVRSWMSRDPQHAIRADRDIHSHCRSLKASPCVESYILAGAAEPVGGDSETTVRLAQAGGGARRAGHRSK